jgi:multiple sugar transport system permease protein
MSTVVASVARRRAGRVGRAALILGLAAGGVIFLSILIYGVLSALKDGSEITAVPFSWLPSEWLWENFGRPFAETEFARYLLNSTVVGVAVTLLNVVTCTLAGYGFAKHRFVGRDVLFLVVLATLMIPVEVIYVPLFALVYDLGWVNSFTALILPAGTSAFGIFLMRQAAEGIPEELLEAARIDGAGELRVLWSVMVPLLKGPMAVLALFIFITNWDSHLWPLLVGLDDQHMTLPVGLANMQAAHIGGAGMPMIMAAAVMALLPTILLFALLQRRFVEGITAAAGLK